MFQHAPQVAGLSAGLLLFPAASVRIQIYGGIAEQGRDVVMDTGAGFGVQLLHLKDGWMDG